MKKRLFIAEELRTLQSRLAEEKESENCIVRPISVPILHNGTIIKKSEKIAAEKSKEKLVAEKSSEKIIGEATKFNPQLLQRIFGVKTKQANPDRLF
ncbi:hypothetical protein II906_00310 [bacterium]|nr:hypothetical protein [bacterium]